MGGKIIEFTKDTRVSIPLALHITLVLGIWYSGAQFFQLKRTIESSWSYNMERESWFQVRVDNPNFIIPDAEKIRNQHQASAFRDTSKIISQIPTHQSRSDGAK